MSWHVRGIPLRGWGLVACKTRQERTAKLNLERQGVRCFQPGVRVKGTGQLQPLFEGYLFFQVPMAWGFVRSTIGVKSVLMSGDRPGLIHPAAMRALLKALNDENYIDTRDLPEPPKPLEPLSPGQAVNITMGVFKNFPAVYMALAPADRVRVVTEFMGQATEVELDRASITKQPGVIGRAGAVATKRARP